MAPMAKRTCPTCRAPLQPVFAEKVELDWCNPCRAIWFDRGELAAALQLDGETEVTRDHPMADCPACRRGMLWTARIAGTKVLACLDCAGCFVTEAELVRRRATTPLAAEFICGTCGDRYDLEQATATGATLVCRRCAPPKAPEPQPEIPSLLGRIVKMFTS